MPIVENLIDHVQISTTQQMLTIVSWFEHIFLHKHIQMV